MANRSTSTKYFLLLLLVLVVVSVFLWLSYYPVTRTVSGVVTPVASVPEVVLPTVTHLPTPEPLKGIYMSACVAGTPSFREKVIALVAETELNAIMIDVKDYSGYLSSDLGRAEYVDQVSSRCSIADLPALIKDLHEKNIYVIARITAFQDPYMATVIPDDTIKKLSDKTVNWKDGKGLNFIDPSSTRMGQYLLELGLASYAVGFDEINYDYIRFPSDGNMKDIYYPLSEARVVADPVLGKAKVMRDFFAFLHNGFRDTGIVISADLFGMTMTNPDDLNIGQILEFTAPYFDYIMPMVYPSHYPKGFNGYENVNDYPYEIIKYSMDRGVARLQAATTSIHKLRPWLQDNDYPVHYTPEMVREQIQATYDSGLTSWMLWDAGNTYTREALLTE